MTTLTYTKAPINPTKLCDEILSAVGKKLYRTEEEEIINGNYAYVEPILVLEFDDTLTPSEITQVNNAVSTHTP